MENNKKTITAHCIIKNEENFVGFAIRSVIDYVEKVLVFDTGSTDKTAAVIEQLVKEYPQKIIFEEKGNSSKEKHTLLRQEMLDRTDTDWFMLLDGDEVWTKRGMQEASQMIANNGNILWLGCKYYLCVGDIYHNYYKEKFDVFHGQKGFFTGRFIKKTNNIKWVGDYELDMIVGKNGEDVLTTKNLLYLKNRYWHLTHLRRSCSDDNDYTSGIEKNRKDKRRLTYFIIGRKIKDAIPEVFLQNKRDFKISFFRSFWNFLLLFVIRRELIVRRLKLWRNFFWENN